MNYLKIETNINNFLLQTFADIMTGVIVKYFR